MRLINVSRFEGHARVAAGVVLFAISSHNMWYLSPLAIGLLLTGLSWYCPLHHITGTKTKAARENYFLSYLPLHNPEPVFIFSSDGKLAFENQKAKEAFRDIAVITDLLVIDINKISASISENEFSNMTLEADNGRTYSVTLKGSDEIDGILAYLHDVTDLIQLDNEIISTQKEMVYTMGTIGETRSLETGHHVRRVAEYSYLLAKLSGLKEDEASLIKLASPMHDIGKVAIPDAVLNKPGKLSDDEFEIMKTHARIGYDMLNHSSRPIIRAAAIIAGEHHEKWDGTGYPGGISGDAIHIYGRITALADVFDALGSDRKYKKAWPLEKITNLILREKGKHFDPELVGLMMENLDLFLDIRDAYKDS